jgi:hypothetical protein
MRRAFSHMENPMPRLNHLSVTPLLCLCFALFLTLPCAADETVVANNRTFASTLIVNSMTDVAARKAAAMDNPGHLSKYVALDDYLRKNKGATAAQAEAYARAMTDVPSQPLEPIDYASAAIKGWKILTTGLKIAGQRMPVAKVISEAMESASPLVEGAEKFVEGKLQNRREQQISAARTAIEGMQTRAASEPGAKAGLNFLAAFDGSNARAEHTADQVINAEESLRNNPVIVGLNEIRNQNGELRIQVSGLTNLFRDTMSGMSKEMAGIRSDLNAIQQDQQYIATGIASILAQQEADRKAREHEQELQERQMAVDTISKFVGFVDPKLGKEMQRIGSGALTVYNAANQLLDTFKKGGFSSLLDIGSAAATGNLIGGVMQIFGLFGDSGPSPEQLIMDQIAEVKQQIEGLRVEMHERFNRVDAKLNEIMVEMGRRFDRIDFDNRRLLDNVGDVQKALVGLQSQLNRIEQNVYIYITDDILDYYRRQVNGALGRYDYTGAIMTYDSQYLGWENDFHYWATGLSKTATRSFAGGADFSDLAMLPQMNNFPLLSNINYLRLFPQQRLGLPALTSNPLANAEDWNVAARAYLILAQENLGYAAQVSESRLDQIVAAGTELQSFIRNITKNGATVNTVLFNALHNFYIGKLPTIEPYLTTAENEYHTTHPEVNRDNVRINLFGGADQSINWQPSPSPTSIDFIDFPGIGTLSADKNTLNSFRLPEPLVNAAYLNVSPGNFHLRGLNFRYEQTRETNSQWQETPSNDPYSIDYRYRRTREVFGRVHLEIAASWGNTIISRRRGPLNELLRYIYYDYADSPTPEAIADTRRIDRLEDDDIIKWVRYSWYDEANGRDQRSFFRQHSTEIIPSLSELQQRNRLQLEVAAQVQAVLRGHQAVLYDDILTNRLGGSTQLRAAVEVLSGAQRIWGAYVSLGLSRAMAYDDYLKGLVYGSEGLLDLEKIQALYTDAIERLDGGENVPKIQIGQIGEDRAKVLAGQIGDYLQRIGSGEYEESFALVDDTLNLIDIHKSTRFVPTLRSATGVTAQVRSQRYDRATNSYIVQFLVRNAGTENLPGPLTLAFEKQTANSALPAIVGADDTALYTKAPFLYLNIGSDNVFSVNESVTVNVTFAPGTLPRFSTRLMAGTGTR